MLSSATGICCRDLVGCHHTIREHLASWSHASHASPNCGGRWQDAVVTCCNVMYPTLALARLHSRHAICETCPVFRRLRCLPSPLPPPLAPPPPTSPPKSPNGPPWLDEDELGRFSACLDGAMALYAAIVTFETFEQLAMTRWIADGKR